MARRRDSPSPGPDNPNPGPPPPPPPPPIIRKLPPGGAIFGFKPARVRRDKTPQESISLFWKNFNAPNVGVPWTILPDDIVAKRASAVYPKGIAPGQSALASYDAAAEACRAKVRMISKECRRINQKYRDHHFDIDLYGRDPRFCLDGLVMKNSGLKPRGSARVHEIFDTPQFYIDGATAGDIKQGRDGDCWFLAAVTAITNKTELVRRICVERDVEVGVYGFVFHRDGEWISTVVDDRLYLIMSDYNDRSNERTIWEDRNVGDTEEEYRKIFQSGSKALYFAQCRDENETWLPLLEKAYAKVHGDYNAIDGGLVGEGIEDLTGGVTTEFYAPDILDKTKFWNELLKVNDEFLFGCHTGTKSGGFSEDRHGILERHAYSILGAVEMKGLKLVKLRNPWGNSEWTGAWSDGSKEWTPEWMTLLNHRFDDDGIFWISFQDLMRKYQIFSRTRLFGPEWKSTIKWTHVEVPWSIDYSKEKFKFTLTEPTRCVIVLGQLDSRYFRGLEGQYKFELQFRLHEEGKKDFIVRSQSNYSTRRSVSTELDLDKGSYEVLLKVAAYRDHAMPSQETVVRNLCNDEREKLLQIGLSYDLAHAKAQFSPPKPVSVGNKEKFDKPPRQERYRLSRRETFERQPPLRRRRTRTMDIQLNGEGEKHASEKKGKQLDPNAIPKTNEKSQAEEGTLEAPSETIAKSEGAVPTEVNGETDPSKPTESLLKTETTIPEAEKATTFAGDEAVSHPDNVPGTTLKDNDKEDSQDPPQAPAKRDHDCPPHPSPRRIRRQDSNVKFKDQDDRRQRFASPSEESSSEPDRGQRWPRRGRQPVPLPGPPHRLRRHDTMESEMTEEYSDYNSEDDYMSGEDLPHRHHNYNPQGPRPPGQDPWRPGGIPPPPPPPPPGGRGTFPPSGPIIIGRRRPNDGFGSSSDDDYGPPDEFTRDPWNAVCVVSLKVLTQKGQALIEVVRPEKRGGEGEDGDGEEREDLASGNEIKRDVDSVAVDEAKEAPAAEKFDSKETPAEEPQVAGHNSKEAEPQTGKGELQAEEQQEKKDGSEEVDEHGEEKDEEKEITSPNIQEKEKELDRQVADAIQDGIETSEQNATAIEDKDKGI